MLVFLLLKTFFCERKGFNELKGLLGAFNNLMENELKKSMLDSPDHCEETLEKMNAKNEERPENMNEKNDETPEKMLLEGKKENKKDEKLKKKETSLVLDEIKKIIAKRSEKESSSSSSIEDENLKREKTVGSKLQNQIDSFNMKENILEKLKDRREKVIHEPKKEESDEFVLEGKPRKIKVVKLVKIPVDENGEEIK